VQLISSDMRVCESWDVADDKAPEQGTALEIPRAVIKELGCKDGFDLFLASEVPPGSGLGCSASMCINLLQAVSTQMGVALSPEELAEKAFHITATVLGKPVGKQDEYAAAHGGVNFITFHRDGSTHVEPLQLKPQTLNALQNRLMLFFTGSTRDSFAILKEQEALSRQEGSATISSLHHLRELALQARRALEHDDLGAFGEILHRGWQWKKRISGRISSDAIDRIYGLAVRSGASGGKITGAGGGGFMLLYCEEEHQAKVRAALSSEGLGEMRFGLDFAGSRVVLNTPGDGQDTTQSTVIHHSTKLKTVAGD
jgi:D-glycero-alpha-D-manno-heptose-7-phosphate kinase